MVGMSRFALLLAAGVVLGAADSPPSDIVARRGDVVFSVADARTALSLIDPAQRDQLLANPQALTEFMRDRLLRRVLLAEAQDAHWDQNAEVAARLADARENTLVQPWLGSRVQLDPAYPSEAEVTAAYEANKARFAVPRQYHIAQIAFVVPPNAPKTADEDAKKKARDAHDQVVKSKADFGAVARKVSQDKATAEHGGDSGWLREDQIAPAVRAALPGLADNAVSDPIRGNDAWHVIKMLGTRPPSTLPLEQVKGALVTALRQARAQQQAKAYMDGLLHKEPIQVEDTDLAAKLSPPK